MTRSSTRSEAEAIAHLRNPFEEVQLSVLRRSYFLHFSVSPLLSVTRPRTPLRTEEFHCITGHSFSQNRCQSQDLARLWQASYYSRTSTLFLAQPIPW